VSPADSSTSPGWPAKVSTCSAIDFTAFAIGHEDAKCVLPWRSSGAHTFWLDLENLSGESATLSNPSDLCPLDGVVSGVGSFDHLDSWRGDCDGVDCCANTRRFSEAVRRRPSAFRPAPALPSMQLLVQTSRPRNLTTGLFGRLQSWCRVTRDAKGESASALKTASGP
jgi:hypothetical protein